MTHCILAPRITRIVLALWRARSNIKQGKAPGWPAIQVGLKERVTRLATKR